MKKAGKWPFVAAPIAWAVVCSAARPLHHAAAYAMPLAAACFFAWSAWHDLTEEPSGRRGALWLTIPMAIYFLVGGWTTIQ